MWLQHSTAMSKHISWSWHHRTNAATGKVVHMACLPSSIHCMPIQSAPDTCDMHTMKLNFKSSNVQDKTLMQRHNLFSKQDSVHTIHKWSLVSLARAYLWILRLNSTFCQKRFKPT